MWLHMQNPPNINDSRLQGPDGSMPAVMQEVTRSSQNAQVE